MSNIEYMEFLNKNKPSKDKDTYRNNEKINKNNTYKNKTFTMSDWERKGEKYIITHIYDIATGEFREITSLEKELNKKLK